MILNKLISVRLQKECSKKLQRRLQMVIFQFSQRHVDVRSNTFKQFSNHEPFYINYQVTFNHYNYRTLCHIIKCSFLWQYNYFIIISNVAKYRYAGINLAGGFLHLRRTCLMSRTRFVLLKVYGFLSEIKHNNNLAPRQSNCMVYEGVTLTTIICYKYKYIS